MNAVDSVEKDLRSEVFVLIVAGGIGSRLIGIGSNDVPKQFTICNEFGETWIQVTAKRFLGFGIPAKNIVVITTNDGQTKLAEEQLIGLGVFSSRIHQIANNYDYAGAMIKGAEFIKRINNDAIVINTPADQHIIADENFYRTIGRAIDAAASGLPILIGVRTTDLNLMKGCGHAIYSNTDLGEIKKVIGFIEKPNAEKANELLNSENSALNTGINVWSLETLFSQSKDIISNKRKLDLEKVDQAIHRKEAEYINRKESRRDEIISLDANSKLTNYITTEATAKITQDILSEVKGWSLKTDELMEVFDNLHVAVGSFVWEDCGTYSSLYKVLKKMPEDKNAKIGGGQYYSKYCKNNLFFVAEGYCLTTYGVSNSFIAINSIASKTVVVVGNMEYCQLVKEFGEKLGAGTLDSYSYSIESKNNHLQRTMVENLIVCFVGIDNHSVSSFKTPQNEIIISISNDIYDK